MTNRKTNPATRHLKEITSMGKEDREKFYLEMMEENMPSSDMMAKMSAKIAKTRFELFKAHVEAGFTEEQAMKLCVMK